MNSFGRIFRVSIYGESHGSCLGVVLDGVPAGIALSVADFTADLARRQGGKPGTTPRKEADLAVLKSGVFNGYTTGAPLLIEFGNHSVNSDSYAQVRRLPRPGHTDLVADERFGGFNDHRGGGHFSGRLTVGIVAAGVVAKKLSGFAPHAQCIEVGGSRHIDATVADAIAELDSVGGIIECRCAGLPLGLGEPFWDSAESLLAHAAFAIPAVKGVEFGSGFAAATMRGSEHNDRYITAAGSTATNHSGGISGGLTNGNELVWRIAVKPTSSIKQEQHTIDRQTGATVPLSVTGRHDSCIALRVPVIMEAITAIVLADLLLLSKVSANNQEG